jgi:hypothetical protein
MRKIDPADPATWQRFRELLPHFDDATRQLVMDQVRRLVPLAEIVREIKKKVPALTYGLLVRGNPKPGNCRSSLGERT